MDKFKTKYNKDAEYTFTIPGIYAYWCTPHKNMGMIGFIVVGGDKSNLEEIKKIRFSAKSKKLSSLEVHSGIHSGFHSTSGQVFIQVFTRHMGRCHAETVARCHDEQRR